MKLIEDNIIKKILRIFIPNIYHFIADDFNSFSITHGSNNNKFTEKWKRIWPENFHSYNKVFEKK